MLDLHSLWGIDHDDNNNDDDEGSSSSMISVIVTFLNQYTLKIYTTIDLRTFFWNKSKIASDCSGITTTTKGQFGEPPI